MSAVKLKGKLVKLEIGLSAEANTDIENLVYARVVRMHDIRPAFVSSTKVPDHWAQPHSWIVFEIALLGYHTAFTTVDIKAADGTQVAYDEDGDSNEIDYFRLFYLDTSGNSKYTDFNTAIIATMEMNLRDTEDTIVIVRGMAYYKTDG